MVLFILTPSPANSQMEDADLVLPRVRDFFVEQFEARRRADDAQRRLIADAVAAAVRGVGASADEIALHLRRVPRAPPADDADAAATADIDSDVAVA